MNNSYEIKSNIEKIRNGYQTRFLDSKMQMELKRILKKNEYIEYLAYKDTEKVIFYKDVKPKVSLLEIVMKTKNKKLEHREILGTVFSMGLKDTMFGDIIIDDDKYYIYVLDEIKDFLINNLTSINKNKVILEERDIELLKDYKRKYLELEFIVSSERLDTVIANLIKINRNKVQELVREKDILLNYSLPTSISKKMQIGDIFSIRGFGKYIYGGVIKETKSGKLIVRVNKYV